MRREEGVLVLDDTTLDKPYAKGMELVSRHWSGKPGLVVCGINLLTLLWPAGPATATTPAGAPGNGLRNLRRWIVEGTLAALVLALKLRARRRETL